MQKEERLITSYYNTPPSNELYNLLWDANGNLAQQTVYSVANNTTTYQGMRYLQWDEDDRLNLVAGDGYLSYYAYGHDGNRAIKMTGNAAIDQSGTLLNSTNLENITIYPNEYLTVTQAEYTKYYYAGGNRIASKIGTGGFEKMTRLCTLDQGPTYNANTLLNFVLYQVTNTTQPPTDEYPVDVCGGYSVAAELLADPLPDFYISQTNLNFTQNNLLQQFRQNLAGGTEPVYYFHSDHLGSASWITSGTGGAVQHLLYLPFGEHFVNEQSTGYNERFTFTGKERDAETGYYYHGARFNSSDIGWLSVDPMSYKYPEITPYHYCHWNPVKLVDPTGEKDRPFKKGDKIVSDRPNSKTIIKYAINSKGVKVFSEESIKEVYNCHSYAWYQSKGDPTPAEKDIPECNGSFLPRWDSNPADDIIELGAVQLDGNEDNRPGDIVIYYWDQSGNGIYDFGEQIVHSAIVKTVDDEGYTTTVIGKRGQLGISENHPCAPEYYDAERDPETGKVLKDPKTGEVLKPYSRAYFRLPSRDKTSSND